MAPNIYVPGDFDETSGNELLLTENTVYAEVKEIFYNLKRAGGKSIASSWTPRVISLLEKTPG